MSTVAATPSHLAISNTDKQKIFWASFLALMAAGVGFVLRSMVPNLWGAEFNVSSTEVGVLFGAGLWPIAITMILFSLIIDNIGYRVSMLLAFVFQASSVILTVMAESFNAMWVACIIAGLGHGIVEACINPMCASIYREDKSKMLNILHAAWPAGIVFGGVVYLTMYQNSAETWGTTEPMFWFMLVPVIIYGALFFSCKKYPIDERVEQNVSMLEMLKEFGGLGASLALTFIFYEIFSQIGLFGDSRLLICLIIGIVLGTVFGFVVKSKGKWIFFFLCLIMIPLATAEIATDGWIRNLMEPLIGSEHSGWALVFSAGIMMVLRFFAGVPLKFMSPIGLLLLSSVFSITGLFALSYAAGIWIFLAFIFYAVGQTFYWPTVLGLVSEQYPKGGAMSLNTVSAMGLLTVGIFGFPFLGAVQDHYDAETIKREVPAVVEHIQDSELTYGKGEKEKPIYQRKSLFAVRYDSFVKEGVLAQPIGDQQKLDLKQELAQTGRSTLRVAAVLPFIMAVSFFLMLLYFRAVGGYRPVRLTEAGTAGDQSDEEEVPPSSF